MSPGIDRWRIDERAGEESLEACSSCRSVSRAIRGVGLSVGERQRLQIARVLMSDPRILILDEATANLDYATEAEVKHALNSMRHGRTTLVIAHRFSFAWQSLWSRKISISCAP